MYCWSWLSKKSLLYIGFFKSHKDLNYLLLYTQHLDYSLINCCWRLSIARVLGWTYMSDKETCTSCFIYDIYNINLYHSSCGICTTYILPTINNIYQQNHYLSLILIYQMYCIMQCNILIARPGFITSKLVLAIYGV